MRMPGAGGGRVAAVGRLAVVGRLAAVVLAVVVVALLAPAVPARAVAGVDYWRWSDGIDSSTRTFAEGRYLVPAHLPRLIVSTLPAAPGRLVRLEYRQGTSWQTEASGRTGADGVTTLELNPYCPDGDWCTRSYAYRLVTDGAVAPLTITYRR